MYLSKTIESTLQKVNVLLAISGKLAFASAEARQNFYSWSAFIKWMAKKSKAFISTFYYVF